MMAAEGDEVSLAMLASKASTLVSNQVGRDAWLR